MTEKNNNVGANRRQYIRTNLRTKIKLQHRTVGELIVHTGDLSDGGVYLLSEGKEMPAMGELVVIQVQGLPVEAPEIEARIVRVDADGVGLEFVKEDDQEE